MDGWREREGMVVSAGSCGSHPFFSVCAPARGFQVGKRIATAWLGSFDGWMEKNFWGTWWRWS